MDNDTGPPFAKRMKVQLEISKIIETGGENSNGSKEATIDTNETIPKNIKDIPRNDEDMPVNDMPQNDKDIHQNETDILQDDNEMPQIDDFFRVNDGDEAVAQKGVNYPMDPLQNIADHFKDIDFTSDNIEEQFGSVKELCDASEIRQLKQFQVLDEYNPTNDDSDQEELSDDAEQDDDLPEHEIEQMLDEDLPEDYKEGPKSKEKVYVTKQKLLIEEKGTNDVEVLPLDWVMVNHNTGIPVYLHKTSRVCTLSRPYFLSTGSVRKHEFPISAIPCLYYKKSLEEEAKLKSGKNNDASNETDINIENMSVTDDNANTSVKNKLKEKDFSDLTTDENETTNKIIHNDNDIDEKCKTKHDDEFTETSKPDSNIKETHEIKINDIDSDEVKQDSGENNIIGIQCPLEREHSQATPDKVILPGGVVLPQARVQTVQDNWRTQHLTHDQVVEYCKKLFIFKTVKFTYFKRWADWRRFAKAKKTMQRPTLPQGTKLITIPAQATTDAQERTNQGILSRPKASQREWTLNMSGRSYVSVFHEYVRRVMQKQPVYEFTQTDNAATPYQASVLINGMKYGIGRGTSKRQAKSEAARESILILIPELKDKLTDMDRPKFNNEEPDFSFFDAVEIEDPRIMNFCASTMEPSPHAILRTCLLRNFGTSERQIEYDMKKLKHQKIEFTMRVGKHSATVSCKNKKLGKQRASQAILQKLHPQVKSWGALLRLYGSRSVKSCKEKKIEEQEITLLQDKAKVNQPNYAILKKLREEMQRLHEREGAVVPIGSFILEDDLPTHSGSNLNNVEV